MLRTKTRALQGTQRGGWIQIFTSSGEQICQNLNHPNLQNVVSTNYVSLCQWPEHSKHSDSDLHRLQLPTPKISEVSASSAAPHQNIWRVAFFTGATNQRRVFLHLSPRSCKIALENPRNGSHLAMSWFDHV